MTSSSVTSGGAAAVARPARSRRSNLAVPGSSPKMLDKARGLPVDQVFMDIEDAVAPLAKPDAQVPTSQVHPIRWFKQRPV